MWKWEAAAVLPLSLLQHSGWVWKEVLPLLPPSPQHSVRVRKEAAVLPLLPPSPQHSVLLLSHLSPQHSVLLLSPPLQQHSYRVWKGAAVAVLPLSPPSPWDSVWVWKRAGILLLLPPSLGRLVRV